MKEISLIIVCFFVLAINGFSQSDSVIHKTYTTKKITGNPPVIDGIIDDKAWSIVPWDDRFVQHSPHQFAKPTQVTMFKVIYNDNNIYFAIRAYDTNPELIETRLSRRDDFEGDWVAVSIDSYNDDRTGFNFYLTSAGVKADVINTNDGDSDDSWDPVWHGKVKTDSEGWTAEMRIPLTQLRFSPDDEQVWGLEIMRMIFRNQELSLWQMIPNDVSGWVSRWGTLEGIEDLNPKREVELLPYVMGKLEMTEKEEGNPFATGTNWGYNAGLDGKIAVTNDLTLNFTVNPDFGQVEADPSQVNLTAFENYFEERRPFFIEGSNMFSFPLYGSNSSTNLFYSRRIGRRPHYYPGVGEAEYVKVPEFTRILGAFKLSGKTKNGWSIAVMESITNKEFAKIDSSGIKSKQVAEPLTNFFNVSIRKDINNGNTIIGSMITATNRFINEQYLKFLPSSAYTGGVDITQYWKNREYYFRGKFSMSQVSGDSIAITELQTAPQRYYQRPDMDFRTVDSSLTMLSGTGGNLEAGKIGGGHWRYGLRVWWLSPGIDVNDMGYLTRSDAIVTSSWVNYIIWEPFSIFRDMNFGISEWSWNDWSGRYLNFGLRLNAYLRFKNFWWVSAGGYRNWPDINRSELRGGPSLVFPSESKGWVSVGTDDRKRLTFEVYGSLANGDLMNSWSRNIGFEIDYFPIKALKISIDPSYHESFSIGRYITTDDNASIKKYLVGSLVQTNLSMDIKINLSLTPDLSIQYWGQPFIYSASYSDISQVVDAGNFDIEKQYHTFTNDEIRYDEESREYNITYSDGSNYTLSNPNFSVFEFKSNLVLRWEYIPGSTAYFVWSQNKSGYTNLSNVSFDEHLSNLVDLVPSNIFLIKFSYRISL